MTAGMSARQRDIEKMAMNSTILKSKLARRFFAMFVICALIPILALAGISYHRVIRQLQDQAFERLHQSAKAHAFSIYEHLLLADQQLQVVQMLQALSKSVDFSDLQRTFMNRNSEFFIGLARVRNMEISSSWGSAAPPACLVTIRKMVSAEESVRLATWTDSLGQSSVAIIRRSGDLGNAGEFLIGMVNPNYLWGLESGTILPAATEACLWDDQGSKLYSSFTTENVWYERMSHAVQAQPSGQTEVTIQGKLFLAAHWSMFLKPRFGVSQWTVMVLEPKDHVFEPLHVFRNIFRFVLILAFIIVVGLSAWAINRSLIPIKSLMEGARRVADRQFSHRVVVNTKDEFSDLAAVFNRMTHELDIQFQVLIASSNMDQAILSISDIEEIVMTGLNLFKTLYENQPIAISLLESNEPVQGRSFVYVKGKPNREHISGLSFQLSPEEYRIFGSNQNWLSFEVGPGAPAYLSTLRQPGVHGYYIFPIQLRRRLFALVSMGVGKQKELDQSELGRIRGLCDHLAVAFANSNLVQELKDLNMGTLYALARTVDAKSSWTAGHSVRVTQLAVNIAVAMGLDPSSQENLRRAGLLHDIGKIGIPLRILDKDGKLTEEENEIVKSHPSIGAKILSPIQAYAEIIPIIEQHHERYDGKGYPFGLDKERIHLLSHILALADTYDAMVSNRPYRKGFDIDKAMQIIRQEAGRQFAPQVVEVFLKIGPSLVLRESSEPGGARAVIQPGQNVFAEDPPTHLLTTMTVEGNSL
jgi:putative nucleotidyltransferase with HDIG domain